MRKLKQMTAVLLPFVLNACTGDSESQSNNSNATMPTTNSVNIAEPLVPKTTSEALADPDASFKTVQKISYTAINSSDKSITLFVYDKAGNMLTRHHLKTEQSQMIDFQLPLAEDTINVSWHYREHVSQQEVSLAGLVEHTFTGF